MESQNLHVKEWAGSLGVGRSQQDSVTWDASLVRISKNKIATWVRFVFGAFPPALWASHPKSCMQHSNGSDPLMAKWGLDLPFLQKCSMHQSNTPIKSWATEIKTLLTKTRNFPSGPVVRIPYFTAVGTGLGPDQETKIPPCFAVRPKK